MRTVAAYAVMSTVLALISCSDPHCPEGQTKIGTVCIPERHDAGALCVGGGCEDGAVDTHTVPAEAGTTDVDASEGGRAPTGNPPGELVSDGGTAFDASTSGSQNGPAVDGASSVSMSDSGQDAGVASSRPARLALGTNHTCFVSSAGQVLCWGRNQEGQLGDGTTNDSTTPKIVPNLTGVVEVAAGWGHTCARVTSGAVHCWGTNDRGELGAGTQDGRLSAVQVLGISDAVQIALGDSSSCALLVSGSVSCWGSNSAGQLGDGTVNGSRETSRAVPGAVWGLSDAVEIASMSSSLHVCARTAAGAALCWGQSMGAIPIQIMGLMSVAEITAGADYSCAREAAATVACWGGGLAQIGALPNFQEATPIAGLSNVVELAAGERHMCVRLTTNGVSCWGYNGQGQLGDGTTTDRTAATPVMGLSDAVEIAAGRYHTCALRASGDVVCWGNNGSGQLGDGTTGDHYVPQPVLGLL